MSRQELIFGGLLSIFVFILIPAGVKADPITGCVKKFPKTFYKVQIGETPSGPCNFGDEALTWSQEGPPGADGLDGVDGEPGPPGEGSQFVLKDNNGNPVGTVVTVGIYTQSMPISGDLYVEPRRVLARVNFINGVGATVPVAISLFPTHIMFHHRVLYQSGNCTGDGFMHQNLRGSGFGPAFAATAIVGKNGPAGERSLYVAVEEVPVARDFNSASAYGNCIPFGITLSQPSVPAELLDPDLHSNLSFPPPYTLEIP